ncbi:MAG: hypothetical protein CMI58_05020 [Parcubacteria group bacterium]|nr:hypothetical protein [Parcubacteria group bacterium]
MKNYFNFSLTDKQKLRDFANKITPPNWHVYLTEEVDDVEYKNGRGMLYIWLHIRNDTDPAPSENPTYGFVVNRMTYDLYEKIAYAKINLQPPPITWRRMKNLLVHELSHVVELRWKGFRMKAYREYVLTSGLFKENMNEISIDKEDITDGDLPSNKKKFWKMRHAIKNFLKADVLMKKRVKKVNV